MILKHQPTKKKKEKKRKGVIMIRGMDIWLHYDLNNNI